MVGTRNSKHVDDNASIATLELTQADMDRIRQFIDRFPTPEGEPFTLERTPGSRYRNIMKLNLNKA